MRMMTSTSPSVVHSRLVGEWLIGSYPAQGPETPRQEILIAILIVILIIVTIVLITIIITTVMSS